MKVKQFFESHPVFRYKEFVAFMASKGIYRPESCSQQLSYHQKANHLIHTRKYLYAVKARLNEDPWIDPYLLASKAIPDGVLAYHTALELHNIAYSAFNEFTFLTSRQIQPFSYGAQRFRGVCQSKVLMRNNNAEFGIEERKREGVIIKLTCLERTVVDVLDRPDLAGGWEEIWRSFDSITKLDVNKMVGYVLLLKNSTTVAKVGYFLEQRPSHFAIDKSHIEELLEHVPKQPHYINRRQRNKGRYFEKWRLIVPLSIVERSWEEPNVENI